MTTIKIISNINNFNYSEYENITIDKDKYILGEYYLFFSYSDNITAVQHKILKINTDLSLQIIKDNKVDEGSGIINISKLNQYIDIGSLTINLAGVSIYKGDANFYMVSDQLNIKVETDVYNFVLSNGNYKINENTTKCLKIREINVQQIGDYDKNYIYNMQILENVKLDVDLNYYLGIGKNHRSVYDNNSKNIILSSKINKTTFVNKGIINGTVCIGCTSYAYDDRYIYVDEQYNKNNLSPDDGYLKKYINKISYFEEIEVKYDSKKINSGDVYIGCNFLRYKDFKDHYLTKDNPELTVEKCSVEGININGNVLIGCNCQLSILNNLDIYCSFVHDGIINNNQTYLNKNKNNDPNITFTIKDIKCIEYNNLAFKKNLLTCSVINVEKIINKNIKCSYFKQLNGQYNYEYLHVFAKEIINDDINATDFIYIYNIGEVQKLNTGINDKNNYVKYECKKLFSKNIFLQKDITETMSDYNVKLLYSDVDTTPNKEIQNWNINYNLNFKENPEFTIRNQNYNFVFPGNIDLNKPIFDKKLILKVPSYDIFYNNGESNPSITLESDNDPSLITENLLNCVDIQVDLIPDKNPRNVPKILKCLFILYLMTENDKEFLSLLVILIIHFYRMYKKIYTGVDHRINMILLYIWNEVDNIFNSLKSYYNSAVNFSNNNLISNSQNYYQSFYLIK